MGPVWGRQDPGGPQVGPINFAIWDETKMSLVKYGYLYKIKYILFDWLLSMELATVVGTSET